jgi:hypothetical protein
MKSFLGLDIKTGGKVVLWTHIIENTSMYILSLVFMANWKHADGGLRQYQSFLLYHDELKNIFHYGTSSEDDSIRFGLVI